MKYLILLFSAACCLNAGHAQLQPHKKMATTTTLPEGTSLKDGKIMVMTGYRVIYGEKDKKVVLIQRTTKRISGFGGGITGSFTCVCVEDNSPGDCSIVTSGTDFYCKGSKCKCYLAVTINPKAGMAITRETKGETWKRFVFPGETK